MPEPVTDNEFAYHQLIETLRLLGLSADEQISALPDYVHVPDELALTFDDAHQMVAVLDESRCLSVGARPVLEELQRRFTEMTAAADDVWSEEALRGDARWETVRRLALEALDRLGEDPGPPTLDWISFVPI